jgi:thioredoxin 2
LQLASEAQFDAMIGQSALPVLLDFWADWCGPCKMLAPELERLAGQAGSAFLVAKVDTEALPGLAARFAIRSIPSLVLFQEGRELARTAGVQPAPALRAFISKALNS